MTGVTVYLYHLPRVPYHTPMITVNDLRTRIRQAGAEAAATAALGLDLEPGGFLSVSDDVVLQAFGEGSLKSTALRTRLHQHPLPDLGKVGIYSDRDMLYHLVGGFSVASDFSRYAQRHGKPLESAERVLDFGCGTSRVLRYMVEYVDGPEFYGSEVFHESVDWGRDAFPEVNYVHQGSAPPLPLDDGFFDIIYAYSIFSHLSEDAHRAWLDELYRLLRPGGLLLLTIQGKVIMDRCRDETDEVRISLQMHKQDYGELRRRFDEDGFAYYRPYAADYLASGGLDPDNFGLTFISTDYIARNWLSGFELLEHDEGAIARFQDYVVLRKREA